MEEAVAVEAAIAAALALPVEDAEQRPHCQVRTLLPKPKPLLLPMLRLRLQHCKRHRCRRSDRTA